MNKTRHSTIINLGLAVMTIAAVVLTGCAKEPEQKKQFRKDFTFSKADFPTDVEYLYLPTTEESSRTSVATRPFWFGSEKIAKIKFSKDELVIYQIEKDERFGDNSLNEMPILSIPIVHVDYKCAEDSYGDCTNQEIKNEEVHWKEKKYFVVDVDSIEQDEVNTLPISLDELFQSCKHEVTGVGDATLKLDSGAINLAFTKSFKGDLGSTLRGKGRCVPEISSLEDLTDKLTFSVNYRFSLVPLEQLATPGYETFHYSRAEEGMFGFFTTRLHKLDEDNNDTIDTERFLLGRWAPGKAVPYYMSESFNKPEHASIKAATKAAIVSINAGLAEAGAKLSIDLREPKEGVNPGDLRYNMIVLEDDPQASGVIGYGPSVTNPRTGEILKANTVMYMGTMKKYVKYAYDDLIQKKVGQLAARQGIGGSGPIDTQQMKLSSHLQHRSLAPAKAYADTMVQEKVSSLLEPTLDIGTSIAGMSMGSIINTNIDEGLLKDLAINPINYMELVDSLQDKVEFESKHSVYSADMFNFEAAVAGGIGEVIEEVGLKPWISLTAEEKQKVISVLLPHVWTPTLIHEFGHNLGLRHNFAGSEDKVNFYSKQELEEMGHKGPLEYSSIMDYAYSTTNELRMFGKYDIAALRFAYAEKIELADGNMVGLDQYRSNSELEIKNFEFCTDEHVSVNPNCNRFDEGTNLTEIAEHMINAYEKRYQRSGFRNGRRSFSLYQDSGRLASANQTMQSLRLLFERYDSIKNDFDLTDDAEQWENIGFLKDLKTAMLMGAKFMVDVMKTSDTVCAIVALDNPTDVVAVVPVQNLSIAKRAVSCFDNQNISLNPAYAVIGEGGKSFLSKKDPRSNNAYADQIDVRGIWMDKLLAAKYLFRRKLGSRIFDKYTNNYLSIPELRSELVASLFTTVMDEVQGPVKFQSIFGTPFTLNMSYALAPSHEIRGSLLPGVNRYLNLSKDGRLDDRPHFWSELVKVIAKEVPSENHISDSIAFEAALSVSSEIPNKDNPANYQSINIGGQPYHAKKENLFAREAMKSITTVQLLSSVSPEKLQAILAELIATPDDKAKGENGAKATSEAPKEGDKAAPKADPVADAIKALGPATIQKFLDGGFKEINYYASILRALAAL